MSEHCLSQIVNIPTLQCAYVHSEDTNQPAHSRSLISVYFVHMKKLCILGYSKCAQGKFWIFAVLTFPKVLFLSLRLILSTQNMTKAKRLKHAKRKYKRADKNGLTDHMTQFRETSLPRTSVNDMWVKFKTEFLAALERCVSSYMTNTKYSSTWIAARIRRLEKNRKHSIFVLTSQVA